jgi:hypothetical protein
MRTRRNRLLLRKSGLAQMHVHVDKAGSNNGTTRLDDGFAGARLQVLGNLDDHAVLSANVAQRVDALRRIDQSPSLDQHPLTNALACAIDQ